MALRPIWWVFLCDKTPPNRSTDPGCLPYIPISGLLLLRLLHKSSSILFIFLLIPLRSLSDPFQPSYNCRSASRAYIETWRDIAPANYFGTSSSRDLPPEPRTSHTATCQSCLTFTFHSQTVFKFNSRWDRGWGWKWGWDRWAGMRAGMR